MKKFFPFFLIFSFIISAQPDGSLNIELLSHYPMSYASDIWGWQDSLTGRRFAFVGSYYSTYIFDITDPRNPVLIDTVPGAGSVWRDMKVWKERLYIVHDFFYSGPSSGLQVVNLRELADNNTLSFQSTFPGGFSNAHNIFIDEKGRAWLWGSTPGNNYIIDLSDPDNPRFITDYNIGGGIDPYIHDGFVRNDTVWGGHIYVGQAAASVFNENLGSFSYVGSVITPYQFTHNVWLSDDGKYLFTTDETDGAPIGIYDISSPNTPLLVATFRSSRNPVVPHNVFYKDGFIYISYYTDGVVVADVRVPDLPVEVAWYDTSPFNSPDFKGCWGVFPFFKDDIIIASDMEQGLFVLKARWKPAVRIYVRVFADFVGGTPVPNIPVKIVPPSQDSIVENTDLSGTMKAGFIDSGLYKVTIYLQDTTISTELNLTYGETDTINVVLGRGIVSVPKTINNLSDCSIKGNSLTCKGLREIAFFSADGRLIERIKTHRTFIPPNATFFCIDGRCNKIPRINVY